MDGEELEQQMQRGYCPRQTLLDLEGCRPCLTVMHMPTLCHVWMFYGLGKTGLLVPETQASAEPAL